MRFTSLFLVLFISFFLCVESAHAQANYDSLRARYLKLRNVDTTISKTDEWTQLALDIEAFVKKNPKNKNTPSLLYDASIMEEKLYAKFKNKLRLEKACKSLEKIARDYPGNSLVDDALVRKGDILLFLLKEEEEAKFAYQEVVSAYPQSDMSPVARARLKRIETGTVQEDFPNIEKEAAQYKKQDVSLVVIDPGHGGEDLGAQGLGGMLEKDISLSMALLVEKKLKEQLGVNVLLTRRSDSFVPLSKRSEIANKAKADLFVSLHVNASVKKNLSGFEVFYLNNTDDASANRLAERENASSSLDGKNVNPLQEDLQFMLSDLITDSKVQSSSLLAKEIYKNTLSHLTSQNIKIKGLGVKKALFYVLVGTHMPSVIVEMLFVDHAEDGKKLANPKFREKFAQSLTYSIGQAIHKLEK